MSLSKDINNPRWKTEVEHPTSPQQEQKASKFSIHQEDLSIHQEDQSSQQEDQSILQEAQENMEDVGLVETTMEAREQEEHVHMQGEHVGEDGRHQEDGKGNPNKKRGAGRKTITLGGLQRVQKSKIRKERQKVIPGHEG